MVAGAGVGEGEGEAGVSAFAVVRLAEASRMLKNGSRRMGRSVTLPNAPATQNVNFGQDKNPTISEVGGQEPEIRRKLKLWDSRGWDLRLRVRPTPWRKADDPVACASAIACTDLTLRKAADAYDGDSDGAGTALLYRKSPVLIAQARDASARLRQRALDHHELPRFITHTSECRILLRLEASQEGLILPTIMRAPDASRRDRGASVLVREPRGLNWPTAVFEPLDSRAPGLRNSFN
jgi:hypothetical protein